MADNIEIQLDLKPEEAPMDVDEDNAAKIKASATKRKGRGFHQDHDDDRQRDEKDSMKYETVEEDTAGRAQRSVEGWIVLVTGVHEEATEEDVMEKFAEFGEIKNMHLNLDRRTGYVKGYALIEYESYKEAKSAIDAVNKTDFLGQMLHCDFGFVRGSKSDGDRTDRRRR